MPTATPASIAYPRHRSSSTPSRSAAASALAPEWIDPLGNPAWDELVRAHPRATIFHSSAWARVLVGTYRHRPHYFRLRPREGGEVLVPLMEVRSRLTGRRGVCLPFSDFCEPLADAERTTREPVRVALASLARDRGWKHAEIRGGGEAGLEAGLEAGDDSAPGFYAHELDLRGGVELVRAGFSDSMRRGLRKAERSGLTVRRSTSWESMRSFLRLHALTRQRHGVPPQPLRFFRNVHRELLAAGHGFLTIVERGGQPLAAAVFLTFGSRAVYKFGASDPAELAVRPNNLALAAGIETLAGEGLASLHLGRADCSQDGLRRFKRSFGAKESKLCYAKFEPKTGQWVPTPVRSRGVHRTVFLHLPPFANRWAGRLLYPHLD